MADSRASSSVWRVGVIFHLNIKRRPLRMLAPKLRHHLGHDFAQPAPWRVVPEALCEDAQAAVFREDGGELWINHGEDQSPFINNSASQAL